MWVGVLREQLGHSVHSPAPGHLELVEGLPRPLDCIGISAHELLPSAAFLCDQACPFQHRDVLLHGREAHRIGRGQPRHGGVTPDGATENVAASGVGQGVEHLADSFLGHHIYNHLVVD